jgi:beta-galactosidase/evolved beta-galactosidase subunit alpha
MAWAQFKLPVKTRAPARLPQKPGSRLAFEERGGDICITGADFEMTFDKVHAVIDTWRYRGAALIKTGPRLNFWRARTDNDRPNLAVKWEQAGLMALQHRTDSVEVVRGPQGAVRIRAKVTIAPPVWVRCFRCEYTYTVMPGGDVIIDVQGTPEGNWCSNLPRIGLQMTLPLRYRTTTWYGRGPGESYRDSKEAGRTGLWQADVEKLYTPYVRPQENGNRTDVQWVALTDTAGTGLLAAGMPNFSAHRFSTMDLEKAAHTTDLVPRPDITLNLDYQHEGIGTGSCGPIAWPQHQLKTGPFAFSVRLTPCGKGRPPPAQLAR